MPGRRHTICQMSVQRGKFDAASHPHQRTCTPDSAVRRAPRNRRRMSFNNITTCRAPPKTGPPLIRDASGGTDPR
ncbi:hypothetical protein PsYK624_089070 [Phanerochaete sordida]|uniref:Uncharacterized protein n=1 Tax=Phanerochaete sordida TaxID=48140 RepID=A0A9P3GD76_9APHY|nr:hypothetical protein PsYK624_089070 [Phanerochaete sordida]